MNRTLLLLIVTIVVSYHCQGQNIGIGTKWDYRQPSFYTPGNYSFTSLEIVSDTLIDSQQFFILDGTCACSSDKPLILRWENNQILQFTDPEIRILYDFNLNAGDTLIAPFPIDDTLLFTLVHIDSTKIIDGLKYQYVTVDTEDFNYQHSDWFGPFVEGIGSIYLCMTPQANLCEISTGGLCTFITANQDTLSLDGLTNCKFPTSTVQVFEETIQISPNPTSHSWSIANTSNFLYYHLYDLNGIEVLKGDIQHLSEFLIDGSTLIAGIYMLTIIDKEGKSIIRQLVKH